MVEQKESGASAVVSQALKEHFNVTLIKHDYFNTKLSSTPAKAINEKAVLQIVYNAPIEEVSPKICTDLCSFCLAPLPSTNRLRSQPT